MHNTFQNIMVSRKTDIINSQMETVAIIGTIDPNKCYKICNDNIIMVDNNKKNKIKYLTNKNIKFELNLKNKLHNSKPKCIKIKNIRKKWNDKKQNSNINSNILGNNGTLELNKNYLTIPIAKTTKNNLAFYNAKLLKFDDIVQFDITGTLPITIMNIGENYVKHFLLDNNKGGGCYIERHSTPHFHMPLDENSNGYLILGKTINNICHLSAFQIPYGFAIYTLPNVIHCDGYLVGNYLVVYTITEEYSTVLIKNNGNSAQVNIK